MRFILGRTLLAAMFGLAGNLLAAEPQAPPPAFRFAEATIDDLQAQMAAGTLTARELTAAYLDRIAQIDRAGPMLRAVIEINPDALAIADQLDAERRAGKVRGPLHGIPVLIKDNIGTADKMETTAGSLALVGARPPRDAFIVTRLREAGAVILGKTNLSEWAYSRSINAVNAWSARGGLTRNPYVLDRTPDGSSSGSAVAVSANLCVVAVGTETDGSIVNPASACGIVGLKPTVGLASRRGIIPISRTQDTPGPLARTVRDAVLLLSAIAGPDPDDTATQRQRPLEPVNYASALPSNALRGARIGVAAIPTDFFPSLAPARARTVAALRAAGATVIDLPVHKAPPALVDAEVTVLDYELKDGLNAWFATLGPSAPVHSITELIAFNLAHREREMPFFGQDILEGAQARGPLTDPAYMDALATCQRLARTEGLDPLFLEQHLDALVTITCGPASTTDPVYGPRASSPTSTFAAVAGFPNLTVPAAEIHGLPVGISFIGPAWSDAKLLALATDFESQTQARREPRFLPTLAAGVDTVPTTAPSSSANVHPPGEFVIVDGARLWVEQVGTGEPVLLIAGGPGCSHGYLHPSFDALAATHRVIYFDAFGRGKSDRAQEPSAYTLDRDVSDVVGLIRELKHGPLVVLGHSYGTAVAQAVAIRHPEVVKKLVLVSPLHSAEAFRSLNVRFFGLHAEHYH
jgi:amidase